MYLGSGYPTSAIKTARRRFRVVHARSSQGAGRPLSLALLPFTHRRQLCVSQRTLGQFASMPATGQEQPINGAGQFAPKQPLAGGAVRVGEAAKPDPDATPRAASQLLRARQPNSVLPDAAPLRSFSRLAGRPAFLRHVAGGTPNSRLKARLKAASDS